MTSLAAATGWTAVTVVLLSMPGSYVPSGVNMFDKVGHVVMFAGFGYLWLQALDPHTVRAAFWTALAGTLYAIGSEIAQSVIPDERFGDPMDALADVVGLAIGLWIGKRRLRRSAHR